MGYKKNICRTQLLQLLAVPRQANSDSYIHVLCYDKDQPSMTYPVTSKKKV